VGGSLAVFDEGYRKGTSKRGGALGRSEQLCFEVDGVAAGLWPSGCSTCSRHMHGWHLDQHKVHGG
jgi:hypothetical protein